MPDPGFYRLAVKLGPRHRDTNWKWKYLTYNLTHNMDDRNIVQHEESSEHKQVWELIPTKEAGYFYLALVDVGEKKYLQEDGDNNYVELHNKTEDDKQKWKFVEITEDELDRIFRKNIEVGHEDWEILEKNLRRRNVVHGYFIINKTYEIKGYPCIGVRGDKEDNNTSICFAIRKTKNIYNQVWVLIPENGVVITEEDSTGGSKVTIVELKKTLESFKNLVYQGPPGTSKTYNAKLLAASVVLGEDDDQKLEQIIREERNLEQNEFSNARFPGEGKKGSWSIVQFHPAYNYEDFVRGIEVKGNGATVSYNAVRRIFDRMAQAAWKAYRKDDKNCPKYVLIIDEINRAHLAAVLGELIYALEYRGSPVDSPYAVQEDGKESTQIIVPHNLYIIGTMNTADRSIGHIDYAVRRRFAFVPLLPEEGPINSESGKKLFREIAKLFKTENGGRAKTLSPEFHADDVQPGHTYFITLSSEVIDELANKFTYQVYPLLREYFKDGILINAPKLFDGKLALDTPVPPEEVRKIVEWFLGQP